MRLTAAMVLLLFSCGSAGSSDRKRSVLGDENSPELPRYAPPTTHTGAIRTSKYVTMSDGTKIAIDLWLPGSRKPGERLPSILYQTRYWRSMQVRWPFSLVKSKLELQGILGRIKLHFLHHGYAWVDVDARGSGASFGDRPWDYSPLEIRDGKEIVDWIISQPWSSGVVGGAGASYSGSTAEFLLINGHPAVKAIAPLSSEYDQYTDILAPGGVPLTFWFKDWGALTQSLDRNILPTDSRMAKMAIAGVSPVDGREAALLPVALKQHQANYDFRSLTKVTYRDDLPFSDEEIRNPPPGSSLARSFEILRARFGPDFASRGIDLVSTHGYPELKTSTAAVLAYSGWLDGPYANAAIKRFLALRQGPSRLVIGPWDHTLHKISPPYGPSGFDHFGELLAFFDHHLKGIAVPPRKPVQYFTMGEEKWKTADQWPPLSKPLALYLQPNGTLDEARPSPDGAEATYTVDLTAGTGRQSRWHTLMNLTLADPYPTRAVRDEKLLVYNSHPLEEDTEVTGHAMLDLFVASTNPDGSFFGYLEDVDPEGRVRYVTEGMLRAIHRQVRQQDRPVPLVPRSYRHEDARPMVPGEIVRLQIELLPTSYLFRKHHRIRIALAGADADHFAVSSPAIWTVKQDVMHPSKVQLPTISR
jgi:hypothetical protein